MLGYYVHSHGSGHLNRAKKILEHTDRPVVVFGCHEDWSKIEVLEHVTCVTIPQDRWKGHDQQYQYSAIHMQECNNPSIKQRSGAITQVFIQYDISYLVIDLSCEVAALAAVFGIPYAYVRLQGDRMMDMPHRIAFEGADRLLCPFPDYLDTPNPWIHKTLHLAYEIGENYHSGDRILILSGKGNGGLDARDVAAIGQSLPNKQFDVLGILKGDTTILPDTMIAYGFVPSRQFIRDAHIVLATAGNTIIQEMFYHRKKYIVIPEWTYYDEQKTAAKQLEKAGLARYVDSWGNTNEIVEAVIGYNGSHESDNDVGGFSYKKLLSTIIQRENLLN